MIEFVYGSDQNFEILKNDLNDHLCHVYYNCSFPKCFSVRTGRLGFEKEVSTQSYALFIDKGISCSRNDVPSLLLDWLSAGTIRFIDYNDLKSFLKSLRILYDS